MSKHTGRAFRLLEAVEASAVIIFFYQALRVLFSVLFGSIYDAVFSSRIPISTVGLMLGFVVLALVVPLVTPRRLRTPPAVRLLVALPVFLARIPLTLNDPQIRLVAAVVIVAGTGAYLVAHLRTDRNGVIRALIVALILDQLLRVAGHSFDISLDPSWLTGQVVVSGVLCLLGLRFLLRGSDVQPQTSAQPGLVAGLAWGAWLFLETAVLAFPNAASRWTGQSYGLVAPLLLAVTLLGLSEGVRGADRRSTAGGALSLVLVLGGLAAGKLLSGPFALTGLLLAQLVALTSLTSLFPVRGKGGRDRTGLALAAGGLLFLLLNFAYAFAFTYPYTLAVFRGMGWAVIYFAGLVMALAMLHRASQAGPPTRIVDRSWAVACGLVLIMSAVLLALPHRPSAPDAGSSVHIATYNIHYGYDTDWHLSLEEQARTIESSGADVVALQEVDMGRPTSYMVDDALWLSRLLDMYPVYLPCVEHLTGIALLSRYPVLDTDTQLLPSELEQTGILWARLDVGGTPLNAFAIWLGLEPEERARQLDAALWFMAERPGPAVFGGDFNASPGTPVYERLVAAGFVDPFVALGHDTPSTSPAINPSERIDFVWLRDLSPVSAAVLESIASDHRLVVVEAALDAP
jgi:endonuclease/exonuclease/phosphatase family metal-dependent hydrolase